MSRYRSANSILVGAFALAALVAVLGARPGSERLLVPRDVQETAGDASPRVGETVHVEGVVTAVSPHLAFFYVGDVASGPWSGVKVEGQVAERFRGESVVVFGEVQEYFGETRLLAHHVESHGAGSLPPPADVTVADLLSNAEPWEGVLIRILDVTTESASSSFGEFLIGDATASGAEVDDEFFTSYVAEAGDHFDSMTGVLAYGFGDFHLEPRDDADLVGWSSGRNFDGRVRVTVVDEVQRPLPSKITFFRVGGGPLSLGPEHRANASEDVAYLALGQGEVAVPSGSYDVVVSRGIEYGLHRERITVASGGTAQVSATLAREVDTSQWISGDFHLHAAPSSDTAMPVPGRVISLAAEGVDWAVATDHNMVTDYGPVIGSLGLQDWIRSSVGAEITTRSPSFGHFNAWPLVAGTTTPPYEGLSPAGLFASARTGAKDEVVQVNHPSIPEWANQYFDIHAMNPYTGEPEQGDFSWDFDAVEVFNGRHLDQGRTTLAVWMRFLNNGRFITATGNSDSHHLVYAEPGYPRNFVRLPEGGEASESDLVEAVRRGASFVSYGPILDFTIHGGGLGDLVAANADGSVELNLRVQCPSWMKPEEGLIWANGKELRSFPLAVDAAGELDIQRVFVDRPKQDTWYVLQVDGRGSLDPVRRGGFHPFAVTNPIRVDVDGDGKFTPPGNVADQVLVQEIDEVDESGVIRHAERWVSVEGRALTDTGFLDPSSGNFYLDDATGGVQVLEKPGTVTPVSRGDRVWVGGFVSQILGELRLVDAYVENRGPEGDVAAIGTVATGSLDFLREPWEGRVVRVAGANVVSGSWPIGSAGGQVVVDDGTGAAPLVIPAGVVIPEDAADLMDFEFTAVLSQRDFSSPYLDRYRLLLRRASDLVGPGGRALGVSLDPRTLGAAFPNPFRQELRIPYQGWGAGPSRVEVIDVTGRLVRELSVPEGAAGVLVWNGRDQSGKQAANGVYWVRDLAGRSQPQRVVKLR
ncbi:MAG: hypothetical protein DHS20C21_18180 [Gemmatimonadota bacterium]|nr:MAG: hypothetical protein DHS20C21_18180 [Gemmatimonadota bacterium]